MKKFTRTIAIFAAILFLNAIVLHAKVLRVGYNGSAVTGVDYADITQANNNATAGDTLHIYGSQSGSINKQLVLQGFGYNLDAHPTLQAIGTDRPSYAQVTLNAGSDSCIFEGLAVYLQTFTGKHIIRRCNIDLLYLYNNTNEINDIKVYSSIVSNLSMVYNGASDKDCKNILVSNSLIMGSINFYRAGSSGLIINCVTPPRTITNASFNLTNSSFLVKNSMIDYYQGNNINTVYDYNLFYDAQPATLPLGTGNLWSQAWAGIFERINNEDRAGWRDYVEFNENYYKLKAGSPAIGAGKDYANNATDCGIFGGEEGYKYRLAGIPAIPSIYKLTAPSLSTSTSPYNITISVKGNN